jgi:DNA-binding MarR family transcriptional regulator
MQHITSGEREILAQSMSQFRRAIIREFVAGMVRAFGNFDFSLPQMATLLLLDEEGELTIKQVAEGLSRSVSATSRLLDQLVERGMISRREDKRDRRVKRVAITERGRTLVTTLERERADAQMAVMEYLSAQERTDVIQAMTLLAEAGLRRKRHEHLESGTAQQ